VSTQRGNDRIEEAGPQDAPAIADIHLESRRAAMPYLQEPLSESDVRDWFGRTVGTPSASWWVVRRRGQIIAYMYLHCEHLDHLYVAPTCQCSGVGSLLLEHAKMLQPEKIELFTFQRNTRARRFYETHGFRVVRCRDGSHNVEREPDVQYEWTRPAAC
jgi:ribosomal protein S18 acetylase RimI-like enzyme